MANFTLLASYLVKVSVMHWGLIGWAIFPGPLSFLHFGTSLEVLEHLFSGQGQVGRRHMILCADSSTQVAPSSVIASSEIDDTTIVGDQTLVFNCTFKSDVNIGSHCIVTGIHIRNPLVGMGNLDQGQLPLLIPDWHCLWEVPLHGCDFRATLCCSVHDNPKLPQSAGTFCGKLWRVFLLETGIDEEELWPGTVDKDLWNAQLFAVAPPGEGTLLAMWLMGNYKSDPGYMLSVWRSFERVSMAGVHNCIDFAKLCSESSFHQSRISLGLAEASLSSGSLNRDLSKLCNQIIEGLDTGRDACNSLIVCCPKPEDVDTLKVPLSRVYQACLDIYKASGNTEASAVFEKNVWDAVVAETAIAVGQRKQVIPIRPAFLPPLSRVKVELPVRIDIVGGWSDTPPWSLEREGIVLNMAILLERSAPVGAEFSVTSDGGVSIFDDDGHYLHVDDPALIHSPFNIDDPFRLVKSALLVTGLAGSSAFCNSGLEIRTWAKVPRGSGLGTSSILAAAVVKGLLRIMGGDDSDQNVSSLVLLLEQLMGTGGGWQDQIGGLYPGLKYTTSYPERPLKLKIDPIPIGLSLLRELEERLLVFYTGQVRLAHQVLQNVVRRYLQRDAILISTVEELTCLAQRSREAVMAENLDEVGKVMLKTWLLHQELDPYCSNPFVDSIFKKVSDWACGYKLVGAGGGGFGILMAKNKEAAGHVKVVLKDLSVRVYSWSMCE